MGIARSTFYDLPTAVHDDTAIVEAIAAICDEFEFYGWRRVRAELRHRGMIVNHKKIRRLMRQHDLQPRQRRRYVATTDSDHDQPIYPNRARDLTIDGLNQLPPRTPLIVWITTFTLLLLPRVEAVHAPSTGEVSQFEGFISPRRAHRQARPPPDAPDGPMRHADGRRFIERLQVAGLARTRGRMSEGLR